MRTILLTALTFLFVTPAFAEEHRQPRMPISAVYDIIRKETPAMACKPGLPLSSCVYTTPESCQTGFSAALEACISGDMKHHEQFMLTADQQKTEASAMVTCAQSTVVAQQKNSVNYKCMSENKAAEKSPFETRYLLSLAADVEMLKAKNEIFKTNDRSLCPSYPGKDSTGCMKTMARGMKIKSAESATVLMVMMVQAALKDKAAGYDRRTASLMSMDAVLSVLESTDPTKFTLTEMTPSSLGEQISRKMLVSDENKNLENFKLKATDMLEKLLVEPTSGRKPASDQAAWQTQKETELRERLSKFERNHLAIK